jgi:predicted dehydrogenase
MPRSYPFSSNIRVLCEGGVAEYAFSAAPAENGGNIGAVTAARGLRLFPTNGEPVTVPVESTDPWGPELEAFAHCVEAGHPPAQGTGEQAREALRVALAVNRSIASGRPERP